MEPVLEWNGLLACALQRALRMSNETFAEHLGVSVRAVSTWHQNPDRVQNPEIQQALDTTLERAVAAAQHRFHAMRQSPNPTMGSTAGNDAASSYTASATTLPPPVASTEPTGTRDRSHMAWLQVARDATAPPDGSDVGQILRWYRKHEDLTQIEVAALLNTTQSRLSKLEKGSQVLNDVAELRYIASKLGIPPERFGVLPDQSSEASPNPSHVSNKPGPIRDSQEHWREVRRELNANRALLGDLAAELYQDFRVPGTTVLSPPNWLPGGPVNIADIELLWRPEPPTPRIIGKDQESFGVRPLQATGEQYGRYSRALRDLARPRLLDNRISYRLVDADWTTPTGGTLGFNYTSYFDVLDVCEAVGHEFADAWLKAGRKRPSFSGLPFRRSITDPFDLTARPMLPSINTLTIRCDPIEGHRIYLHRRDAAAVAAAGGMYHVSPAGIFQPAALAPAHQRNDFSLWRNVQREFSEEFLGNAEHDGNSGRSNLLRDRRTICVLRASTPCRRLRDIRLRACARTSHPVGGTLDGGSHCCPRLR